MLARAIDRFGICPARSRIDVTLRSCNTPVPNAVMDVAVLWRFVSRRSAVTTTVSRTFAGGVPPSTKVGADGAFGAPESAATEGGTATPASGTACPVFAGEGTGATGTGAAGTGAIGAAE